MCGVSSNKIMTSPHTADEKSLYALGFFKIWPRVCGEKHSKARLLKATSTLLNRYKIIWWLTLEYDPHTKYPPTAPDRRA